MFEQHYKKEAEAPAPAPNADQGTSGPVAPSKRQHSTAAEYVAAGMRVFPLAAKSKKTTRSQWNTVELPATWADEFTSDSNVALRLDGLVCVDPDDDSGVTARVLDQTFADMPTLTFGRKTRPGKRLYKCTDAAVDLDIKIEVGGELVQVLEVHGGAGHYTVYPPGVHGSGETIEFQNDLAPAKAPVQEVIDRAWMTAAISMLVRHWSSGQRNELTIALGRVMHQHAKVSEAKISAVVNLVAALAGDRPEPGEKSRGFQAVSAMRRASGGRRMFGWPKLIQILGRHNCTVLSKALGIKEEDHLQPWEQPVDLFGQDLIAAALARGLLPKVLDDLAHGNPEHDPAAVAYAAIIVAGIAIGARVRVRATPSWSGPPILFGALYGEAGAGKTPAQMASAKPLQDLGYEAYKAYRDDLKAWEQRKAAFEGPGEFTEPEPLAPRYWSTDATPEKCALMCEERPDGFLILVNELTTWLFQVEGGRGGTSGLSGHYCAAYDTGEWFVDRVGGRGTIHVPNFAMSVLGGITPSKLRDSLYRLPADGLLARLGFIIVGARAVGKVIAGMDPDAHRNYCALLKRLLKYNRDNSKDEFHFVDLTPEALELFGEFRQRVHADVLALKGELPRYAERRSKAPSEVLRLCTIFGVIEGFKTDGLNEWCDVPTMQRAISWQDFQNSHDLLAYESLARDAASEPYQAAITIAEWILGKEVDEFQIGEVTKATRLWRTLNRSEQVHAVELLIQAQWLRADKPPVVGGGLAKGVTYTVNPEVHALYREKAEAVRRATSIRLEQLKRAVAKHMGADVGQVVRALEP